MSDVSVVIPLRDGGRYLEEAIGSVLGGSVAPAEVVVVDDGSVDAGPSVAAAFGEPVRVISQAALGIAAATNRGIAAARGDLIAFIDADDLWVHDKLEVQLDALRAEPALEAVFGHACEFHSPELTAEERDRILLKPGERPARLKGTGLLRRDALARVGPFDETLRVGEFVDWHSRATDAGLRSVVLDRVVLERRLHAFNHGRVAHEARMDYVKVARAALERRRGASR